MATPNSRPTYGAWLDQIATQGRTDDYGLVASAWLAAKTSGRPKLSAVRSVNAWLSEHAPPGGVANLQAALHALEVFYHDQNGLPPQDGLQPPPGVQQPLFQPPDPAMVFYPEQPPYDPAGMAGYQQPAPPAESQPWIEQQAPADQPWQQQGPPPVVPEHPWQVVMLKLGELETLIASLYRGLEPLMQLAAEATAVEVALDASQLAAQQPVTDAQQRVQEIAAQHGWTPGPAFEAPEDAGQEPSPDFYGGHAVPPNFAAMADASDGSEDGAQ